MYYFHTGNQAIFSLKKVLFVKIVVFKTKLFKVIGAEVRDSCGSSGTGETPQAFTPRMLTARLAESEHLEGKSTTTHYLVNSNKVCENSLKKSISSMGMLFFTNSNYPYYLKVDRCQMYQDGMELTLLLSLQWLTIIGRYQ
ncbi:hypothetical protein CMV16_17040 [Peribacillus simplex]|nr:hypothetical protein CMV16_17040 [Peribacillus simplex]